MTWIPARGFLTSWAIAAAISPSAARRSRRRSRSSICSTRVRSCKTALRRSRCRRNAGERPRTLPDRCNRSSIGEVVQFVRRGEDLGKFVPCTEHVRERSPDLRRTRCEPEDAIGHLVDDGDGSVGPDGHDPVAHAQHEIATEGRLGAGSGHRERVRGGVSLGRH